MPSLQYPVDPNMYQYLINHPDVAVSTWRAMGSGGRGTERGGSAGSVRCVGWGMRRGGAAEGA